AVAAAQKLRPLAGPMPHEGADHEVPVFLLEPVEPLDAVDVDERPRRGDAQLHHRDQALPACQHLRLVAEALKDRDRLVETRRSEVLEGRRIHRKRLLSSRKARETGLLRATVSLSPRIYDGGGPTGCPPASASRFK